MAGSAAECEPALLPMHSSVLTTLLHTHTHTHSQARVLKGSTLLLSVSLQYQGVQSAVVYDVSLAPQDGYEVRAGRRHKTDEKPRGK